MAEYTDNYGLIEPTYAELADIDPLNRNIETIDEIMHASQVSLADAYDLAATYNTGDVVMYQYLMYKCKEDNVTGAWDATKWERTTAGANGSGGGGTEVVANPVGTPTANLQKIGIAGIIYDIPNGGGGGGGRTEDVLFEKSYLTANPNTITLNHAFTDYDEIHFWTVKKDDGSYYDYLPINIVPVEFLTDAMAGTISGRTNVINISGWQPQSQYLRLRVASTSELAIVVNNNNLLIRKIVGIKY